jgi:type II secretory pathway pseudopilin PulG
MHTVKKSFSSGRTGIRSDGQRRRAFTLVEVMVAASVMVLTLTSSLLVVQQGMRALDTARYTTLAGQVLQSQMEKLRLLTWTQLTNATSGPVAYSTFTPDLSATATSHMTRFVAGGVAGKCSQSIVDAPSPLNATMKVITLTADWKGIDGTSHTLSYITFYGKSGISDFFFTTH